MAFQLKPTESVSNGIKRSVKREIEKVLDQLDAGMKARQRKTEANEAVHEIRKSFKKIRAALRLVRDELGDELYRADNFRFRDAARPLTSVRDAEMLVEVLDNLRQKFSNQIDSEALSKVRDSLRSNQIQVARLILDKNREFVALKNFAASALERLSGWKIERDGWEALEGGLRRVYRTGHRALRLAEENPSVENLHEWRKQTKYLWHLLQLLQFTWADVEKNLGDQAHRLSRILGEDHDLAVLRQTLAADPLTYGGHSFLKELFVLIDRSRKELEQKAFDLGQQIYKDQPKAFTARIESYWKSRQDAQRVVGKRIGLPVKGKMPNRSLRSLGAAKQRGVP